MKRKLIMGMLLLLCAAAGCSKEKSADTDQSVQESIVSENGDDAEMNNDKSMKYTKEDMDSSFSANNENQIKLTTVGATVSGAAEVQDNTITISEEGTYVVSGSTSDARIVINLKENGTVKLVLNNASVSSKEDAPIYSENGKLIVTLAEGSSNYIEDSDAYTFADENGNPSAAIFSKDDLTVNGTGSLEVKANYKNAIQSKKTLKIVTGTYKINAVESGFVGRGGAMIRNGNYSIVATGQNETIVSDAPETPAETK